jgi:hypothetical protein
MLAAVIVSDKGNTTVKTKWITISKRKLSEKKEKHT